MVFMPSTKNRACAGKVQYDNKNNAEFAMHNYIRHSGAAGKSIEVYKCKFCNCFHFGHKRYRRSKSR